MSDVNVKILEAAKDHGLLALEDAKVLLDISADDTSKDQQLQMTIDQNSSVVARLCNRVFAKEKVRETWRCIEALSCPNGAYRIFLTHYPVKETDIESVESPKGTLVPSYEIEEQSGKLTVFGGSSEIVVTYTGGYNLPFDTPDAVKQACEMMIREARAEQQRLATSGIRSLSHKDARVMFFDPTKGQGGGGGGATNALGISNATINSLLMRYVRIQV